MSEASLITNTAMIDFKEIAASALGRAENLLSSWLPNGRRNGTEYRVGSINGEAGKSLSINLRTGVWKDFATGDKGGDLISLFAAIERISQPNAAKLISQELGLVMPTKASHSRSQLRQEWTRPKSVTASTPPPEFKHKSLGNPTMYWKYQDSKGDIVCYILRFDPPGGKKEILPMSFCQSASGQTSWQWKGLTNPRPLYCLPDLLVKTDRPVLVVEGEKSADAAQRLVGDSFVVTTWPGGAKAVNQTDWSPLKSREVYIWPDADKPGIEAAAAIVELISGGIVLRPPDGVGHGWDLADGESEGWTNEKVLEYLHDKKNHMEQKLKAEFPSETVSACRQSSTGNSYFLLPSAMTSISESAKEIFACISSEKRMFRRGDSIVEVQEGMGEHKLVPLSPEAFRSRIEGYDRKLMCESLDHGKKILRESRCSMDTAKALMASKETRFLPGISVVTACSILDRNGNALGQGYHDHGGGVFVTGSLSAEPVPLENAVKALTELLRDFDFASPGDLARALAAFITPALSTARLLPGRGLVPIDIAEANASQAGKGYRHDMVSSIYGERRFTVVQRLGGVGSFDESLSSALYSGRPFIQIDNFRGELRSQLLESVLTNAQQVSVRVPYKGEIEMDCRSISMQLSSNGFSATPDLANRACFCLIRKRPMSYTYHKFPEGDVLEHIKAKRGFYLGCVFSVIKEWLKRGSPQTSESRHNFRDWARSLDYIVGNIMGVGIGALLDDHNEAAARTADPGLTWLRRVGLEVLRLQMGGRRLRARELAELADEAGIVQPGVSVDSSGTTNSTAAGRILLRAFGDRSRLDFSDLTVMKDLVTEKDHSRKRVEVKYYTFDAPCGMCGSTVETPRERGDFPRSLQPHTAGTAVSTNGGTDSVDPDGGNSSGTSSARWAFEECRHLGVSLRRTGDTLETHSVDNLPSRLAETLTHWERDVLLLVDAEAAGLRSDECPYLSVAWRVICGDVDGASRGELEGCLMGVRTINHPLCRKARARLEELLQKKLSKGD